MNLIYTNLKFHRKINYRGYPSDSGYFQGTRFLLFYHPKHNAHMFPIFDNDKISLASYDQTSVDLKWMESGKFMERIKVDQKLR